MLYIYIYNRISTKSQNQVKLDAQNGNPDHNTQTEVLTIRIFRKKERITTILLMTRKSWCAELREDGQRSYLYGDHHHTHHSVDFQY